MKTSTYMTRALRSKDRRYAVALGKLGYAEPLKAEASEKDPLDHDGDGRKGGSVKPEKDEGLVALRAEYKEVVGRRAFANWDAETLRVKIAEARDSD